ncbi:hypothetical protein PF005_g3123 [Phytophthora fragariae]|uniref:Uncharacterized protein n=1 Tax=Phytophthora fragariae TaxID=53985 RepID=A0A6A3IKF9_9STRA|nr:hypothetical protein PF003_g39133 [Phytophthora fragariae]KAE8932413.1 hypothetical protein PF009_g17564 [Phytophthora fragariae]KAE8983406.1 hypothetical protein PF011_g21202 [Phytophthora fragariae]KAE9105216.1 hypothetical protein PF006_g21703 [Phytophthora fragariae]KAE9126562.1 hypothetical protein PF010_g5231 [Phytophthora fragariae]
MTTIHTLLLSSSIWPANSSYCSGHTYPYVVKLCSFIVDCLAEFSLSRARTI